MHMSIEEPEEMDPVIDPELKEKALKEMGEWGTEPEKGKTLEELLERNIRAARKMLRTPPAPDETMVGARRKVALAAFEDIGVGETTRQSIIDDIVKRLGN